MFISMNCQSIAWFFLVWTMANSIDIRRLISSIHHCNSACINSSWSICRCSRSHWILIHMFISTVSSVDCSPVANYVDRYSSMIRRLCQRVFVNRSLSCILLMLGSSLESQRSFVLIFFLYRSQSFIDRWDVSIPMKFSPGNSEMCTWNKCVVGSDEVQRISHHPVCCCRIHYYKKEKRNIPYWLGRLLHLF